MILVIVSHVELANTVRPRDSRNLLEIAMQVGAVFSLHFFHERRKILLIDEIFVLGDKQFILFGSTPTLHSIQLKNLFIFNIQNQFRKNNLEVCTKVNGSLLREKSVFETEANVEALYTQVFLWLWKLAAGF